MFRRKTLALALAATCWLSLALPATAAPASAEAPSIVAAAFTWVAQALGFEELLALHEVKSEDRSGPALPAPPTDSGDGEAAALTTENERPQDPGSEMGIFPDPGG